MFFMRCFRASALAAVCGGWMTASAPQAQAEQRIGDVTKQAGDANPSLCLADFSGPAEVRQVLLNTLKRCDWFTVVDGQSAAYRVRASYGAAGLEMQVEGGKSFAFRQPAAEDAKWTVYRAVDSLIAKAFEKPGIGLCATTVAIAIGNSGRGRKELFTCNFDGSNMQQLTHNNSISTEPSWGPTWNSLLYTVYNHNCTDVALVDPSRKRQRPLSQFPGLNSSASLAPNGQMAALTLSRDHQVDLYLLGVSGRGLTRLTSDQAVEASPCWSPDGSRICFVSDRARKPRLYVVSARGGQPQALPRGAGAESVSPSWSKVSNKICFATGGGDNYQLAVIDMVNPGAPAQPVETKGGSYESPSWMPDGRHVVCTRKVGRNSRELCMVDTETGRAIKILDAADVSLPACSPLH